MALPAPDVTLWEAGNYSAFNYAWIHSPAVVFECRVNMASVTYPCTQITYDAGVGSYTNVTEELLMTLGTTLRGSDLGRQRVHADSSGTVATATTINIGRSSQGTRDGELDIQDDGYLTVYDLRPVWAAAPFIDTSVDPDNPTTYKDGVWAFNSGYAFKPVALAGPDRLKIVNSVSDTVSMDFDGSGSYITHPDATSIAAYFWSFPGATPSTSTSAAPTGIVFPTGYRYISLSVTDDRGQSQSTWRLIAVVEKGNANLISKFTISRHSQSMDGQELQIKVDSALPYVSYPDGTEILLAQRENYNGTVGSLTGYPGAEETVFAGWIQSEQNSGDATKRGFIGRTTLTLVDAAGRLKSLPGFPQVVERDSAPERWEQMQGANIDRYLYYLEKWHSNISARVDFTWSGTGETYAFATLGSDGSSLYDQIDKRCQAIAHRLTCNKNGQLAVLPDPQLLPTSAQAATYSLPYTRTSTVVVPITEHDWLNYQYAYTRAPRVHWNRGESILVSTDDADAIEDIQTAFVVAPGLAPGQGLSSQVSGQQLAISLTELEVREGNRYVARMNAREGYFQVEIRPGDVIDPALMTWVQFEITSDTAGPRGRTYLSERFLPMELNHTYNPRKGLRTTKITMEREGSGTPAVLDPQYSVNLFPVQPGPVPQPSPVGRRPFPPPNGAQPTRALLFSTFVGEAKCAIVTDLTTFASIDRSTGLTPGAEAVVFGDDAWDYGRILKVDTVNLQVCSDIEAGTAWTTIASIASLLTAGTVYVNRILSDHKQRGWFGMCAGSNVFINSRDGGLTWSAPISINGLALDYSGSGGDSRIMCDVCVFPFTSNALHAMAPDPADTTLGALFISTDGGDSWTKVVGHGSYGFHWRFHVNDPYMRNGGTPNQGDSSMEVWVGAAGNPGAGAKNFVFVSTDKGATYSTSFTGAFAGGGLGSSMPVNAWTYDAAYGWTTDGTRVANSSDHWGTSAVVLSGLDGQYVNINLWPPDANNAIVCDTASGTGEAHITNDFGASWASGLPSGFSGGVIGELSLFTIQ